MNKKIKQLQKVDVIKMFDEAKKVEDWLEKKEGFITTAYSQSKMTLVDEMDEFEKYNKMLNVEFYEFLGRISELLYHGMPLEQKLENMLTILLPLAGYEYKKVNLDGDLESESDYDDDIIDNIIQ